MSDRVKWGAITVAGSALSAALLLTVYNQAFPTGIDPAPTVMEEPDDQGHAAHAHGHSAPKHADPGPRRLSVAEIDADRAASFRAIGTEESFGEEAVRPDGERVFRIKGHGELRGNLGVAKRVVPWAMGVLEAQLRKPELAAALHGNTDHEEHRHCAQAFYERTGNNKKLTWNLLLHLNAQDGRLVIDDAEHHEPPPELDSEVIDCYTSAFRGVEFDWPETESFYVTWSVCINKPQTEPPADQSAHGAHDHSRDDEGA